MDTTKPVRLLVVDDHRVFAEALALRLETEPDIYVLGTVSNAAEATEAVAALRPDVVVLDEELRDADGIELTARLRRRHPELRFLILTCLVEDWGRAADAVRAGASAWVSKDAPIDEMLSAVRGAVGGDIATVAAEAFAGQAQPGRRRLRPIRSQRSFSFPSRHRPFRRPAASRPSAALPAPHPPVRPEEPAEAPRSGRPGSAARRRLVRMSAVLAIVALLTGPAVLVSAAQARPGQILYPARLSLENLRLAMERDPAVVVALHLRYAKLRAEELSNLLAVERRGPEVAMVLGSLQSHQQAAEGRVDVLERKRQLTAPKERQLKVQADRNAEILSGVSTDARCEEGPQRGDHCHTLKVALESTRKVQERLVPDERTPAPPAPEVKTPLVEETVTSTTLPQPAPTPAPSTPPAPVPVPSPLPAPSPSPSPSPEPSPSPTEPSPSPTEPSPSPTEPTTSPIAEPLGPNRTTP